MNKKEILFEFKPCHQCKHTCVEGQTGIKCPFDSMVENFGEIGKKIELGIKVNRITKIKN